MHFELVFGFASYQSSYESVGHATQGSCWKKQMQVTVKVMNNSKSRGKVKVYVSVIPSSEFDVESFEKGVEVAMTIGEEQTGQYLL